MPIGRIKPPPGSGFQHHLLQATCYILGCIKTRAAPSPTCLDRQGGTRKGMRPVRQRKVARSPPNLEGFLWANLSSKAGRNRATKSRAADRHPHGSEPATSAARAHGTREGAAVHRGVHRERKEGGPVRGTLRLSKPDDLMYREGLKSYSPHWAHQCLPSKPAPPKVPEEEPARDDDAPPRQ